MKSQVGGRRKTIKILFYIFIFFYSNANAATIYDFQIENLISNHLNLIQKNNEKIPIEYSVILDENPNAFINEKRKLFITTGLLKYAPSYKALLGVLAHELGHLKKFHFHDLRRFFRNFNDFSDKFFMLSKYQINIKYICFGKLSKTTYFFKLFKSQKSYFCFLRK